MGTRRQARELAMQALFYMDIRKHSSQEMLERFCENFPPSKKMRPFFMELVNGVLRFKHDIDALIEQFSKNWKIGRMTCVDRNVMRIAVYEMLYCGDIPLKVSINEAVDVGKKYGDLFSGLFGSLLRFKLCELFTQGSDGGLDNSIAQESALRFQSGDSLFQLLAVLVFGHGLFLNPVRWSSCPSGIFTQSLFTNARAI